LLVMRVISIYRCFQQTSLGMKVWSYEKESDG
jgi:hypothetical protein